MSQPECPQTTPYGVELQAGDYWWCACGKSKNQPFCDGAHKDTDFEPVKFSVDEKKTVWLCGCKRTRQPPLCDSSHNKL